MQQTTITYACGAIVSDYGRVLVSKAHGSASKYYVKDAIVSIETYVPLKKKVINELHNEGLISCGINLNDTKTFKLMDTREVKMINSVGLERLLNLFVYKAIGKFEVKNSLNRRLELLPFGSITDNKIQLSIFSEEMMKRLHQLFGHNLI